MRQTMTVLSWLAMVLVLTAVATVAVVAGNMVGALNDSPVAAVVLRTVFTLLVLATTTAFFVSRSEGEDGLVWLTAALVSYALIPFTWEGNTLFGNQFLPWWAAILLDLCVWAGLALVVVDFESGLARKRVRARRASMQSGFQEGFHQPYRGQW